MVGWIGLLIKRKSLMQLFSLNKDKALGLHGFTFLPCMLEHVKWRFPKLFSEFTEWGILNASPNTIFITLIPKYGLEKIAGFKTISLVASLCKMLLEVLASQLKELMKYIMLHFRGAFVHERNHLDGMLGCIDSRQKELRTGFGIHWHWKCIWSCVASGPFFFICFKEWGKCSWWI